MPKLEENAALLPSTGTKSRCCQNRQDSTEHKLNKQEQEEKK
jgi:hypothetical protein